MNVIKKQDLLNKKAGQYKTMDTAKKQDLLNEKPEQYKAIDTAKKTTSVTQKSKAIPRLLWQPTTKPSIFCILRLIKAALV